MPHFHHLPIEIGLEVTKWLCPHCTHAKKGHCRDERCTFTSGCNCAHHWNGRYEYGRGPYDAVALVRLCRASKCLNSIATSHLYHRPTCARWWLLARTLVVRPDLGLLVRALHGHLWILSANMPRRFPRKVLDHYRDDPAVLDLLGAREWEELWDETTPLNVLTSLCPNLEELEAAVEGDGNNVAFGLGSHESLKRLKSVELRQAEPETNGGMEFGRIMNLTTQAPNLTRIVCHSPKMYELSWDLEDLVILPFANLIDLRLYHSIISAKSLPILFAACPNIQSFTFESRGFHVGDNYLTPWSMQEALARYAPTLVSLSLDCTNESQHLPAQGSTDHTLMRSLTALSKLEHIMLDLTYIIEPTNESGTQGSPSASDPELLVHLLPASIRSFKLKQDAYVRPDLSTLRKALTHLAAAVPERFPQLEQLTLAGVGEEILLEAKLAFEAHGIKICL